VSSLVGGDGDALGIFLDGTFYDFCCRAVMAQVDYFGAFGLHDATHDINSGIVPIEKRSCCYYTNFVSWRISHIVFGV
jgi:hypothetical protein